MATPYPNTFTFGEAAAGGFAQGQDLKLRRAALAQQLKMLQEQLAHQTEAQTRGHEHQGKLQETQHLHEVDLQAGEHNTRRDLLDMELRARTGLVDQQHLQQKELLGLTHTQLPSGVYMNAGQKYAIDNDPNAAVAKIRAQMLTDQRDWLVEDREEMIGLRDQSLDVMRDAAELDPIAEGDLPADRQLAGHHRLSLGIDNALRRVVGAPIEFFTGSRPEALTERTMEQYAQDRGFELEQPRTVETTRRLWDQAARHRTTRLSFQQSDPRVQAAQGAILAPRYIQDVMMTNALLEARTDVSGKVKGEMQKELARDMRHWMQFVPQDETTERFRAIFERAYEDEDWSTALKAAEQMRQRPSPAPSASVNP